MRSAGRRRRFGSSCRRPLPDQSECRLIRHTSEVRVQLQNGGGDPGGDGAPKRLHHDAGFDGAAGYRRHFARQHDALLNLCESSLKFVNCSRIFLFEPKWICPTHVEVRRANLPKKGSKEKRASFSALNRIPLAIQYTAGYLSASTLINFPPARHDSVAALAIRTGRKPSVTFTAVGVSFIMASTKLIT